MPNKDITILFVDDESSVLHALERYLIREPFNCLFSQGGTEALEIMGRHPVHVVVTDMQMPGMDGIELLRRIKKSFPEAIRVVLSGYSRLSKIIPAVNSGEIYRYITKPIEPDLFRQTLNDAIDYYLLNQDRRTLVDRLKKKNQELSQALEEKNRVQAELDHAQARIEKNLLNGNSIHNIDRLDVSVMSRSAKNIGGDFYDIINVLPNRFDIVIGDVMGKGILAALVGAGTKQCLLKALAQRDHNSSVNPPSPAMLVQQVQPVLTPGLLDLESFVTILWARIDLHHNKLVFADCGHPPIIQYLASEKKCIIHKGKNMPLGIKSDEIIRESEFDIHPNDLLFFLSDGIIETRSSDNKMFGLKHFVKLIESHHHLSPANLISLLEKKLTDFRGMKRNEDDMTCICVAIPLLNTGS